MGSPPRCPASSPLQAPRRRSRRPGGHAATRRQRGPSFRPLDRSWAGRGRRKPVREPAACGVNSDAAKSPHSGAPPHAGRGKGLDRGDQPFRTERLASGPRGRRSAGMGEVCRVRIGHGAPCARCVAGASATLSRPRPGSVAGDGGTGPRRAFSSAGPAEASGDVHARCCPSNWPSVSPPGGHARCHGLPTSIPDHSRRRCPPHRPRSGLSNGQARPAHPERDYGGEPPARLKPRVVDEVVRAHLSGPERRPRPR